MLIIYSDDTLFKRTLGASVINKRSKNNHSKVLCLIFAVMSGNL